ncbi:thermonuclease family protein [Halobacteriovorax sp. GB3]|uniref:thermonuclease family protein n=1 Tax=Halobacteriovorax sp. GB3 TaxID=2719615 RepID=UPI00235DD306|nr:thermonuclease family protein [Halobacteriovorax sp. GB3]MDD0852981.1 thermonuclease family protein [Halobacteriovorax sp. GB3]
MKYVDNYDGDTITVNIPNVHPLLGKKAKIRVNGVDTPELRTKDKCEKRKGRMAKKLVRSVLKNGKVINLTNVKKGKYFRIVADVQVDGKNLSDILLKNKLAYPYRGKTKKKVDWCN